MMKRLAMVLVLTALLGSVVVAASPMDPESVEPNARLASLLKRTALLDLGLQLSPSVEDYACAQSALSIALEIDPANADLARLVAEAAWSSGDQQTMLDATRIIVRNDPRDTVALLRLISAKINTLQTVEARLAAYARYLGPAASSIDASVRSRLALDAALLERETGNAEGFLERLALAHKLDPSNKDAVSLGAQIFGQGLADPVARLNLQIKILMADPLDPHIHMAIAKEMATQGAVVQAKRFLDNAANIYTIGREEKPQVMREQRIALAWQISGPHALVKQLNASIADSRAQAASAIEARQVANEPTDDIPNPDEIRMDLTIDRIRLLAAYAIGDEETVTAALNDINRSTAQIQQDSIEASKKRTANQQEVFRKYVHALLTLEAMRAVVGREGDQMRQDSEKLSQELQAFSDIFQRIEPWILYSEGKYQEAIDGINPETTSVNNMIILALAYEKIGDINEAVRAYAKIARGHPLSAFGAFARSRLVAMDRTEDIVTAAGHQMVAIERTIPPWIEDMIENPTSFMYLSVEPTKEAFSPMEDAKIRITIRNLSSIPLAIGAANPIESRFLLVPSVDTGSNAFKGKPRSKVLELNRRLRLNPVEELVVVVDADDPYTDWLIDLQSFSTLRGRWRVLQGFTTGRFGGLSNSPFGLVTETPITLRLPLMQMVMNNEQLLEKLESDGGLVRRETVRAIASLLVTDNDGYRRTLAESQALVQGLIALYARASSDERAEMLLVLPHAKQLDLMTPFDEQVRELLVVDGLVEKQTVDPDLLCAVLLTRVTDPENPVFEVAKNHEDRRVRILGELLQQRLVSGGKSYATARGMFDQLVGESSTPVRTAQ